MAAKKQKRKRVPVRRLIAGASLAIVEAGKNTRFRPGVSGNPSGRPALALLSSAYRDELGSTIDPDIARRLKVPPSCTVAEAVSVVLCRRALQGSATAARELCDRTEGKAPQFIDFNLMKKNADGSEITPDRAEYVNAVREALGFKRDPVPQTKQEVTIRLVEDMHLEHKGKEDKMLFHALVRLIEESNDKAIIESAGSLALHLKKKLGIEGRL